MFIKYEPTVGRERDDLNGWIIPDTQFTRLEDNSRFTIYTVSP